VFLNLLGAAKGALIRAAASTQPWASPVDTMSQMNEEREKQELEKLRLEVLKLDQETKLTPDERRTIASV
jgi:hypothetical protein